MKLTVIKFILTVIFIAFYSYLFEHPNYKTNTSFPDSISTVNLTFVGDIMCHLPEIKAAQIEKDSFDFKPVFQYVKKYLDTSDITFGNLETVIGKQKDNYKGYPLFNSPPELLEALKYAGFDFLFTSNNHAFDQGYNGLKRTLNAIKENGMQAAGTYVSKDDYDSLLIIFKNNIKIGILAYTYDLNLKLKKEYKYCIKFIDTLLIKDEIRKLKEKGAEIIIVYFHFGDEYKRKVSNYQKKIVNKTIEYGADLIIGSHPHVVQPMKLLSSNKSKIKKVFVAYSLGNFLSNQRWRYSDSGVILNVVIKKNNQSKEINFENISIIPTWVYKSKLNNRDNFLIIPSDSTLIKNLSFLSNVDKMKILRAYNDVMEMYSCTK